VRRLVAATALLTSAALGAACGERSEPLGELAQPYPVRVQGAGDRATVLGSPPERIVALSPGPAEAVLTLGGGERLVGVPAGVEAEGNGARRVARATGQINLEAVIELKPDLVLASEDTDRLDLAVVERETEAPVYVQPANSVEQVERGIIGLGFLLGRAPAARALVGSIRTKVGSVESRLAGVAPVSVFVDTGFGITVPASSLLGDLVRRAKGKSVAGATPGPGPFPPRQLARANPDVYVTISGSGVTLASLRRDPQTRQLRAVRKGHVAVLPAELVTRPGPQVGEALETVARALHPNAFG